MKRQIRVGSRDSKLAVMQTRLVMDLIKKENPDVELELVTLKTTGDMILNKTLDKIGGKGLFVKELDQALLEDRIDISIHSLKDVPMEVPKELPLKTFVKRGDPRDVLVLPHNSLPQPLERNIGSSSARRLLQLKALFSELHTSSIRGNIMTRIEKLDRGEYSALILAASGLIRAGLKDRISRFFSVEEMIPAAGQGILAVQTREDFDMHLLEKINHNETAYQAIAERSFVRTLDGGCSSPIAAFSCLKGREMKITGLYYDESSGKQVIDSIAGNAEDSEKLGYQLAIKLKNS